MLRYHNRATPLNWTMMAWSRWATFTAKQNRIYQFFQKKFNEQWLQFLFVYSFSNGFAVWCFSCWKAFVKCPSLSVNGIFWWRPIWRHLHITMLQCWAEFSNGLEHWSIRMIPAKNEETVAKFVKVMPKIMWPRFFRTRFIYSTSRPDGCLH